MEKTFLVFLLSILAFFFSSIPFGYVIAKLKGIDIRKYGSGNIGATNVTRVLGKKYGALVLFLDAIKGAIFVILGKFFSLNLFELTIIALFAILGHMFSPFLKG
ncbi:MAG TPA: acyl-phosphate glycerol 3-phosphate acyltransferase, partial [Aquificae bacterium]|nr:acyl-phosphate glycerol 3-phosphate acyltransferase [Aquificota bacterium]